MNLPQYSLKNKLVIHFFLVLLTIGGVLAFGNLPKKEDAPFVVKQAVLTCQYSGASAAEVEELITTPIEREIQTMPNVHKLKGESYAGFAYITIELDPGTDPALMDQLWDDLRKKAANVQTKLPAGAGVIAVNDDFGDVYGIYFGLTADEGVSYAELRDRAQEIKTLLTPIDGVSKITTFGEQQEVVTIFISPASLSRKGLSPADIIQVLSTQNTEVSVGPRRAGVLEVTVLVQASYRSIDDIRNQLLPMPNGVQLRLGDIAKVEKGYYEPAQSLLRINGSKAIGIAVATAQDHNVVRAGALVRETIARQVLPLLPYGYELVELYPEDTIAAQANNDFLLNLVISVVTIIVLLFFFYRLRTTVLIGTALIFCIAATLFVMQFFGTGLNRSSLAAFIIAMGMLVDNAIVVADNARNNIKRGMKRREALLQGAIKPMWGLFGATCIAIISFLPLYLASTAAAEIVHPLFVVLSLSLGFSWLFALTQTTTYGDFMLKENVGEALKDPYDTKLYKKFGNFLYGLIRYRWATLGVVVVLLVAALWALQQMPSNFFPYMKKPYFRADLFLPEGYGIDATAAKTLDIEKAMRAMPGVKKVATAVGASHPRYYLASTSYALKPNFANMLIEVNNADSAAYFEQAFYNYVIRHHPDMVCRSSLFKLSAPVDGAIEILFSGHNIDTLQQLANRSMNIIRSMAPAVQVDFLRTNWGAKVPVCLPDFSEEKGERLGVTRLEVAQTLALSTTGLPLAEYRERDLSMPILLKSTAADDRSLNSMRTLPVFNNRGQSFVLEQVTGGFDVDYHYYMLWHYQRERTIVVRMDPVRGGNTNATFKAIWAKLNTSMPLPEGYRINYLGEQQPQDETFASIRRQLPLAFILLFIVLLFLFGNYKRPLTIVAMIPLIIIGVVIGLAALGKDFDFFALLGLLGLVGMNVKSAVILVDEIVLQTKEGMQPLEAVIYAAKTRLVPVLTGAVATIVGMAPLLFDPMFGGMAATIMGGLLMATILTILVLPVAYSTIYRLKANG